MGKAKRFTDDEVGNGLKYIQGLPHKAGKTQAEVAAIYAPSIQAAMKRGYTLEEIQEGLAKTVGVSIQMTKFKTALEALANDGSSAATASPYKETARKAAKKSGVAKNVAKPDTKMETATPSSDQKLADKTPTTPDQNDKTQTAESAPGKKVEDTASLTSTPQPTSMTDTKAPVFNKERINLNCRKEDHDMAKSLGAKWDNDKTLLYLPPQTDLRPYEKWLPKPLSSYVSP